MAGRLKDLLQDVFGDSGVKTTHVERSLVGLGSRTSDKTSTGCRRRDAGRQGRRDGGRDRVSILRNDYRGQRGRHVATSSILLLAGYRRRRALARSRRVLRFSRHLWPLCFDRFCGEKGKKKARKKARKNEQFFIFFFVISFAVYILSIVRASFGAGGKSKRKKKGKERKKELFDDEEDGGDEDG